MSTGDPYTTSILQGTCGYCGGYHVGMCPRVKSIEYHPDGRTKRVEFYDQRPVDAVSREAVAGRGVGDG